MAYFKIEEPNKKPKWVKSIDNSNGTIEFTTSKDDRRYNRGSGIVANSEAQRLKFHFGEKYPELAYLRVDDGYSSW